MLRKPTLLFSTYNNLLARYSPSSHPATASKSSYNDQNVAPVRPERIVARRYATVGSRSSEDQPDDLFWPQQSSVNAIPTPYQILCINSGDPYSKHRFYQLAKRYHPDRHGHDNGHMETCSLSGAVKMERYRLVVAAHEILSDPNKRSAYDATGAGWNGRPEHRPAQYQWGQANKDRWSGFDTNDSPFSNATWEDWEKWYMRDKAKQEPVYFSNGGFLMLVITVVFLGGFGQSIRVGDYSDVFQRQVEKTHSNASKVLQSRKMESTAFGNKDERLQSFLRSRDPHRYGVTDPMEEGYRKLLPEPEVCMSQGIEQQGNAQEEAD